MAKALQLRRGNAREEYQRKEDAGGVECGPVDFLVFSETGGGGTRKNMEYQVLWSQCILLSTYLCSAFYVGESVCDTADIGGSKTAKLLPLGSLYFSREARPWISDMTSMAVFAKKKNKAAAGNRASSGLAFR